ncbi:hypothetical protein WJX72_001623 [[Myrmecia] bisecta]|uniref:U-box domain-containing protein n=1 Tax=[Myrmecia] bisecta TaxID=41462 RepID=A0AAW1PVN4_9CHLO
MAVTWRWRTFVKDAPLELDFTYVLSRDYDKSGVSCRIGVNGLQHRRFMVGAKGKYSFTIDKPELGSLHGAEVVIKVKNKLLGSSLKAEEAHVNGHDLGKPYKVQPGEHSVFRTDWEFPYGHMRYRLTIKVIKHAAKIYLNGLPIPLAREIKVSDTFALSYEMRPTNLGMGDIGAIDRIVVTLHHLRKENYEAEAELLDSRGSTLFTRQSLAFVTEPKEEPFVWQCMAGNSESDLQDVLTMTRDAIHANGEGSQPGSVASREWPPTPEPTTEASRPAAHSVAVDTADLQPTQQTPSSSADQTTPSPEQARQREALQAAEGRVAALEVRLRELHTRSRQLQGENQALRRANRELADDKQATDVGSVQLQIRHRELQAQAQDLRNTVQRLRDGQQAAQAGQTEELEEALQDTQDLLAASKDRVRQLTQELRDGQARVASRDARIAELLEETGRLNTEVNRSRAAHAALLRELTSSSGGAASDTAKALAAAQHRTEVAVQEASQAQASAATANEALHTARLALHGVLAGVRDELSDVRAALKAAQEESAEKGRELTTLQQSLKQGYMIDQSAHEAALEAVEQRWKQSLAAFFSCPISGEVFRDPVLAADGHTYERVDIRRWLRRKNTSPQTRQPLPIKVLVPNHMVRSAVQELIHGGMLEAPPERSASDGLNAG